MKRKRSEYNEKHGNENEERISERVMVTWAKFLINFIDKIDLGDGQDETLQKNCIYENIL